jgi:hypothetical protein
MVPHSNMCAKQSLNVLSTSAAGRAEYFKLFQDDCITFACLIHASCMPAQLSLLA